MHMKSLLFFHNQFCKVFKHTYFDLRLQVSTKTEPFHFLLILLSLDNLSKIIDMLWICKTEITLESPIKQISL